MDIHLHYTEQGNGKPLILLHGNGENHTYFSHQIEAFSQKFRVIAVDTRGHGNSPRGTAPFTIVQFAEDLHAFMLEHKIDKAHLLGFSDGGNIALYFVLKYPQMVDKLILNGANLCTAGVKRTVQFPVEIGYRIAKLFSRSSEKALKNTEILGLMVNEPNIATEELHHIQNKTLVIVGTKDMIKESHSRLIYDNLPNAELAFVDGNHFIADKNPDDFNKRVLEFLKDERQKKTQK